MRDLPAWKVDMYLTGLQAEQLPDVPEPAAPEGAAEPGDAFTELPPYLRT